MIALAEPEVSQDEKLLAIKLHELARKLAERKIDGMNLPHATRRRLERNFDGRVGEVLTRAASDVLEILQEVIAEEV